MAKPEQLSEAKRKLLEQYRHGDGVAHYAREPRIPRRPQGISIPLSFSQQQVWVHSHMVGDIPVYNETVTIYRRGSLDLSVLERCLTEIVRRHEIWRTTFQTREGKLIQFVQPAPDKFSLRSIDLRPLHQSERLPASLRLATEDTRKAFDLSNGPLLRATLVRIDEEEHRLYMTFHQIVFDSVSVYRILLPELASLYEAFCAGKPSPLAEPILQYGDFAYWQQNNFKADVRANHLSFWSDKLSEPLPVVRLTNDRVRPAFQTHRGAIQRFQFDSRLIGPLKAFCCQEHVSSYATLLASYATLICRYTAQHDIIIGGLSSGRKRPELEAVVGYFVNPVVFRLDLSGNPTFRQLTRRVMKVVVDALTHDEIPFQDLVESLQLRPDLSRNPIFQLIFSLQPYMTSLISGWDLATEEVSSGGSIVDLTVVVDERTNSISGPLTYNPDLFDASTIARMVDHWQALLAGALEWPDQHISDLPLLTEQERQQLLIDWNETSVYYPPDKCLHQLIEAQVNLTPDAVALRFEDKQMTYRELNARGNQLAHCLTNLGVRPGMVVGLYLERCFDMVVGLLGILKVGAICLPLDPSYPKDRLSYIVADTQATILLTHTRFKLHLPLHSARVLCIDTELQSESVEETLVTGPVSPDNVAYIIYTSGSTGCPKGVQVTHRGLVNSTMARSTYYRDPIHSFLLLSSFAFDSSLAGIFWSLSTGGTLVLPPDQSRWDLHGLLELVGNHHISHLLCVPSLYRQFLEEGKPEQLSFLRVAIVAGEECSKQLVDQHYRLLPRTALFNEYGPTEATVWSTVYHCRPNSGSARVPVGRPIANTKLYVLDSHLQPLPIGLSGELFIGGLGVTPGYLKDKALNEQKFISNPFKKDPDSRLYKTGDLVRYLPDGNLELLGRLDNQVKIRGFRVELEEIEYVIREYQGVRNAIVVLRQDPHPALVGYIVPASSCFKVSALRSFLKRKLPDVMIPATFVLLNSLPLMPNGKINRYALPGPHDRISATKHFHPKDDLESKLVQIWESVLGRKPASVTDDFFDLGGHSLLVVKLMFRIEQAFGKKLSLGEIAEASTIREMATLLRTRSKQVNSSAIVPIQAKGKKPPLFWVRGGPLFVALGQRLGCDQPLLGLHLPSTDASRLSTPYKLEEVAAAFVRHVRTAQSVGPYYLAGLCVNGVIAYEMASQLIAQGQEVRLLALFDAQNPEFYRDFSQESRAALFVRKVQHHLSNLPHLRPTDLLEFSRERFEGIGRRLKFLRSLIHYVSHLPLTQRQFEDLDTIVHPASYFYKPKAYPGHIVFFQSTNWPKGQYWKFHASWNKLIHGCMEVHYISGGHESMFHKKNVDVVADKLQKCLSEAQISPVQRSLPHPETSPDGEATNAVHLNLQHTSCVVSSE